MADLSRINLIMAETDGAYHDAAVRLGLSDSALRILYAICAEGGSCQLCLLPRTTGLSKQTIHSALRKLEKDAFLCVSDIDGKKKSLCLTPEGRELTERTIAPLMALENAIFDAWPEQDLAMFLELNQRYLTQLKEKIKEL